MRLCRAVGIDVHGVLVERGRLVAESPDPLLDAHVAQLTDGARLDFDAEESATFVRRRVAECYREAIGNVLGITLGPVEEIEPQAIWEAEQRAFERVQRAQQHSRRPLGHRKFLTEVNLATLQIYFPRLVQQVGANATRRIARAVRRVWRVRNLETPYLASPRIQELIAWIRTDMQADMYFVTALERDRFRQLMEQCGLQEELASVKRVFCAEDVGANKLSQYFWKRTVRAIGIEPHEFLMIGNEVSIDAACTGAGIPALILDRGGMRRRFYIERQNGSTRRTWNRVPLLDIGDPLPVRRPFIGFASTPRALAMWLSRFSTAHVQRDTHTVDDPLDDGAANSPDASSESDVS